MPLANRSEKGSLANKILKQLPLADKTAVWGTLGTIRPLLSFEVEQDVQSFLDAIAGEAVDYRTITHLLTNRTNRQRQQIAEGFQAFTQQDLLKSLQAAVSGNLETALVGLLKPAAQYDAHEIKLAMKGYWVAHSSYLPGPDGATLAEIFCTRTTQQLREILDFYKHDFKSDLETEVASGPSGCFKDLLLALIKTSREKYSGVIDYVLIEEDAKALVNAGAGYIGRTDERKWIKILAQRSPEHLNRVSLFRGMSSKCSSCIDSSAARKLRDQMPTEGFLSLAVFSLYHKMTGLQIEEAVAKFFQGNAQVGILTLVSVLRNTPLYFAIRLRQAIKGPSACHKTLIRILVSRSETDLLSIRAEFRKQYGMSLYSFIRAETQGQYRDLLLGLCRAEDL
ncbi:annexin A9-like [Heteronotia binoei]|uniref:annexin A9-like n=1 Tax=Heteronotia binoei TaxID=13085 RepID=UPI00292DD322|nr:annexin A9-like [Heteronotia binoei]